MKKFLITISAGLVLCALGCADRQEHAADETTGSSAATSSYGTGGAMGPAVVQVTGSGTAPTTSSPSTTGSGEATATSSAAPAKPAATPAKSAKKP